MLIFFKFICKVIYKEEMKYVNLVATSNYRDTEGWIGNLAINASKTLVYHTSSLAADIQIFVLITIDCLVLGISFSSVLMWIKVYLAFAVVWATNLHFCVLYNGLFTLGANFPKWRTLSFSRNFSNLEMYDTKIEKLTWAKVFTKFMLVHVHPDSDNRHDVCLNRHNSQSICSSCAQRI